MKLSIIDIGTQSVKHYITELVIGTREKLLNSAKFPFGAKLIRKTFVAEI